MKKEYPPVIALIGKAGSGKTIIAKYLELNYDYVRVSFAETLKDMLREMGLSEAEISGSLKEEPCSLLLDKTPRHAMQTLGTEWGRNLIHEDLWANIWKVRAAQQLSLGHKVVCDDCRYKNELRFINKFHGSEIWKVGRLEIDLPNFPVHISEKSFQSLQPDRILLNHGTPEELQWNIDSLLGKWSAQ